MNSGNNWSNIIQKHEKTMPVIKRKLPGEKTEQPVKYRDHPISLLTIIFISIPVMLY
jgi:hypothetical protein